MKKLYPVAYFIDKLYNSDKERFWFIIFISACIIGIIFLIYSLIETGILIEKLNSYLDEVT